MRVCAQAYIQHPDSHPGEPIIRTRVRSPNSLRQCQHDAPSAFARKPRFRAGDRNFQAIPSRSGID